MTTSEIRPYYECFCYWFKFHHLLSYLTFIRGNLDAAALTPFIRDWAEDITKKEPKKNEN